jgi:hypothetical protein
MVEDVKPHLPEEDGGDEAPPEIAHRLTLSNAANKENHREKAKRYGEAAYQKLAYLLRLIWNGLRWFFTRDAAFWTALATVLMFVTTGIYTYYARKQWKEMQGSGAQTDQLICIYQRQLEQLKQSNEISQKALIASNRAYIGRSVFRWISHINEKTGKPYWEIVIEWANTGNTPPNALRIRTNHTIRGRAFKECPFIYDKTEASSTPIPPKSIAGTSFSVDTADLWSVRNGDQHLYVWGIASYYDAFPGTPLRTTQFCVEAAGITGDPRRPFDATSNAVDIPFATFGKHNCTDEECEDHKPNSETLAQAPVTPSKSSDAPCTVPKPN